MGQSNASYVKPIEGASPSRIDMGCDYCVNSDTDVVAIGDAKILQALAPGASGWPGFGSDGGGGWITYVLTSGPLKGQALYFAETITPHKSAGDTVRQGEKIATASASSTCLEFGWATTDGTGPAAGGCYNEGDATASGQDFNNFMVKLGMPACQATGPKTDCGPQPYSKGGAITVGPGGNTASGGQGSFSESDLFAIGRASAFSTYMQLPGLENSAESLLMKGAKSIFNDQALMEFVQQLCQASLRQFQSLPNGAFFAFFPDQFGLYGHRKPYWAIEDIEIVDGGIELTDESLVTHLFVVGDTNFTSSIDISDMVQSKGVVTIFDYFGSSLIVEPHPKNENQDSKKQLHAFDNAVKFLQKYGQRPLYQEAPFIRNGFFEVFYAYTQFETLWANQFRTTFSFTFMPELYPGGRVAFPDHDIQCYIDSVTHTFDYESGFVTQANLSAPSATKESRVTQGMLAPFTTEAQPFLKITKGDKQTTNKPGGQDQSGP